MSIQNEALSHRIPPSLQRRCPLLHVARSSLGRASQPDKHNHCAVETHDILVLKPPNRFAQLGLRDSSDLVNHETRQALKSVRRRWLNRNTEQFGEGWISREWANRDGRRSVEPVVLQDRNRPGFAGVAWTTGGSPDIATLHVAFHSEMESMKAWSSLSYALWATASDCRCACAAKRLDRTSGTQIWMGRRPAARSALRCFCTRSATGLRAPFPARAGLTTDSPQLK